MTISQLKEEITRLFADQLEAMATATFLGVHSGYEKETEIRRARIAELMKNVASLRDTL